MGYTTYFDGSFTITPPLKPEHAEYINTFAETRRMKRNTHLLETKPDPLRKAVGLPLGIDGEYYVGSTNDFGQDRTDDVVDYNSPPSTQPGLWCQWIVTDGNVLGWDGGAKFYSYDDWLQYLLDNFFIPWGYTLNGEVDWSGEENGDLGKLVIKDNILTIQEAVIDYQERR